MAGIQILNPLEVDYTAANSLMQSGLKSIADAPTAFQTQINANQQRHDADTLGLIQQLAMKYAPDTAEYAAGQALIERNNPNAYIPEQSILAAQQSGVATRLLNAKGATELTGLGIANENATVQGEGYVLDNAATSLSNVGKGIANESATTTLAQQRGLIEEQQAANRFMQLSTSMTRTPEEDIELKKISSQFKWTDNRQAYAALQTANQQQQTITNSNTYNMGQLALGNRNAATSEGQLGVNAYSASNPSSGGGGDGGGGAFPYPQSGGNSGGNSYAATLQHGESRKDGYNATNKGARHGYKSSNTNASNTTVGQVLGNMKAGNYKAFGRYQFHEVSFPDAVRALPWLKSDTRMTPEVQDRIMSEYYVTKKRPAIGDYISGRSNNIKAAINASSAEWRSMKGTNGKIFEEDGINKASVGPERVGNSLTLARNAYQAAIRGGADAKTAMRIAVTSPESVLGGTAAGKTAINNANVRAPQSGGNSGGIAPALQGFVKQGTGLDIAMAALEAGASDRAARQTAAAGNRPGLEAILGNENAKHFVTYAKSRNISASIFESMTTKEQKGLLKDYTDYLEDTAKAEHTSVNRKNSGNFLAAKDIPDAMVKLGEAYSAKNGGDAFKDGKTTITGGGKKEHANKVNPYNQGLRITANILTTANKAGSLSVYDGMLTPKVIDKAIRDGMAEYKQYLSKVLSKSSMRGAKAEDKVVPLIGRSDYAISRFEEDGYIHDEKEYRRIIKNRIDYAVKAEQKERQKGVAAVDTAAGWSGDIKNIRAALANIK